jgi:hypothetical protein
MAGLRMVWINDTVNPAVPAGLAKAAYKRMGTWAFEKRQKWIDFIRASSTERLHVLATSLTASFVGEQPSNAPNMSPRVLILHNDTPPMPLTQPNVDAYHRAHEVTLQEDGTTYTQISFKGDPLMTDFQAYFGDYATDEGEAQINLPRARRMFAMMLITKCR